MPKAFLLVAQLLEKVMTMKLTIADKEQPDKQITLTDEQAKKFRSVILEEYAGRGKDPSKLTRRNPIFIKARNAVASLDKANFWEREYDDEEKYWIVVWLARMLKGLRKRYANPQPAFLEVF